MRISVGIGWYVRNSPIAGVELKGYSQLLVERKAWPSSFGKWALEEIRKVGIVDFLERIRKAEGSRIWYRTIDCPFCGRPHLPPPEGIDAAIAGYGGEGAEAIGKIADEKELFRIESAETAKRTDGYPDLEMKMHVHNVNAPEDPFEKGTKIIYLVGEDGMEIWVRNKSEDTSVDEETENPYGLKWIQRFETEAPDWDILDAIVKEAV